MSERDQWQELLIPGTNVLRNLHGRDSQHPHGTEDAQLLAFYEQQWSARRFAELMRTPLPGELTYDYMKSVHRYLFRDTYVWSGEQRTVPWSGPMTKLGPPLTRTDRARGAMVAYRYLPAEQITDAARDAYSALAAENYLRDLPRHQFVDGLARHWGRINEIHSFREGNTRSQFAYFKTLCADAGWTLNTEDYGAGRALRTEFVNARYFYQRSGGNHARLARVLDKGISTPRTAESGSSVRALLALTRSRRSERPHPSVQSRFHPEHLPAPAMVEPFRGPHPEV